MHVYARHSCRHHQPILYPNSYEFQANTCLELVVLGPHFELDLSS